MAKKTKTVISTSSEEIKNNETNFLNKLDQKGDPEAGVVQEEKPKRHRRTKAEMLASRGGEPSGELSIKRVDNESGWEVWNMIPVFISQMDSKNYGFEPCDPSEFEPFSKNFAKCFNYFAGNTPPIFILIGMTLVQGFTLALNRSGKISEYKKKKEAETPDAVVLQPNKTEPEKSPVLNNLQGQENNGK